jgi:hypothetical protein
MDHVLHGNVNADGEFGGWHMHPGSDPDAYPAGRFINGTLETNADGTATVRGTVGSYDEDWNLTTKKSIGHTFFPESWGPEEIAAAGEDLLANGTYSRNGSIVTGAHRGVSMTGLLSKGKLSTFFPNGG